MSRSRKLTPEGIIKRDCKRELKANGWYVFHVQQGALSHKGISDLIAVRDCQTVFIELKASKGRQSADQIEFERELKQHGGVYMVVRNIQNLIDVGMVQGERW